MPSPEARGSAERPWRVVILGGFGCVGQLIARDMQCHLGPDVELTLAGRHADADAAAALQCRALQLDIEDAGSAARLAGFDFAVIAAGPTTSLGAKAQRLCIDAGVACLDINDSIEATRHILALHEEARRRQVDVFTGFGLMPGLSTLLLMRLVADEPSRPDRYRLRLYMGARTAGGPASSHVLSAGFRDRVAGIVKGATLWRDARWHGSGTRFRFSGAAAPVPTLPFSSPEAVTIPAHPMARRIADLDVRYHVQFLPIALARLGAGLSRIGFTRGEALLARLMSASAPSAARRRKSSASTVLVAEADRGSRLMIGGAYPAPALTAAFASAAAARFLRDRVSAGGGVWAYEQTHDRLPHLADDLARRGIVMTDDADAEPSSPADGRLEGLRHAGRCWYDTDIPHEIQARQWQLLRGSALWSALKAEIRPVRRPSAMLRFAARWRKLFTRARSHLHAQPATVAGPIARDLAMFAAGYGICREVLGTERAFRLYRRMFLETGAMEMDWLWPGPRALAAQPSAAELFLSYVAAYFGAYRKLGIYEISDAGSPLRLDLSIDRCLFSEILTDLSAAELAPLIRQMEMAAIARRGQALGCETTWGPNEGTAIGALSIAARAQERLEVR